MKLNDHPGMGSDVGEPPYADNNARALFGGGDKLDAPPPPLTPPLAVFSLRPLAALVGVGVGGAALDDAARFAVALAGGGFATHKCRLLSVTGTLISWPSYRNWYDPPSRRNPFAARSASTVTP
jgi:hypothetical protein